MLECDIDEVLDWAKRQGIKCIGIRPQYVGGRGIGIFAARRIAAGEIILQVPERMLRTVANTPKHIVSALPGASTHAILAASLCLDDSEALRTWSRLFPSREDVRAVMPICWAARHQELLPEGARDLLKAQKAKFAADWAVFGRHYTWVDRREYLYHWLLVNTRTFYYRSGTGAGKPSGKRGEDMALQPVADLFNHLPGDHCEAEFIPGEGFWFTANRDYAAGEELFVRYGAHGNDTLLVEYGFSLPGELNAWDELALLEFLRPLFGRDQRALLEQAGFWGRYALDRSAACYRTQIALRLLCIPQEAWLDVVAGERDEDRDSDVFEERWRKELRKIRAYVLWMRRRVESSVTPAADDDKINVEDNTDDDDDEENSATAVPQLRQRWTQILELVELELKRLGAAYDSEEDDDSEQEQDYEKHSGPPIVPEAKNSEKTFDADVRSTHDDDDDEEEEEEEEGRPVSAGVL